MPAHYSTHPAGGQPIPLGPEPEQYFLVQLHLELLCLPPCRSFKKCAMSGNGAVPVKSLLPRCSLRRPPAREHNSAVALIPDAPPMTTSRTSAVASMCSCICL